MQPWFLAVWIPLSVVGFLVFHVSRDFERKERWHAPFMIGTAVIFLAFVLSMGGMGGFGLVRRRPSEPLTPVPST